MAIIFDIEGELKTLVASIDEELLLRIKETEDPITFGYKDVNVNYMIFVHLENLGDGVAGVRYSIMQPKRVWLISKIFSPIASGNFSVRLLKLKDTHEPESAIVNALKNTSNSFQVGVAVSKEPLTLSYASEQKSLDKQLEVIGFKTGNNTVEWQASIG